MISRNWSRKSVRGCGAIRSMTVRFDSREGRLLTRAARIGAATVTERFTGNGMFPRGRRIKRVGGLLGLLACSCVFAQNKSPAIALIDPADAPQWQSLAQ